MKGSPDAMPMLMKSTRPVTTSVSASGPPLNGMWVASIPAATRRRSAPQCVALPMPAEAKVKLAIRPASINSFMVLNPFFGETTVTLGTMPNMTTPAKSLAVS